MEKVAIFGAPRSGTSWLGQIFNSSPHVAYRFQPLFSYTFKGRITLNSKPKDIEQFYDDLFVTKDEFVLQKKNISGEKGLAFRKEILTHLVWKEVRYHYLIEHLMANSSTKVIGLVRHPCAVINSWLQAPKEFDSAWDPLEEWRYASKKNQNMPEEYNGYEKWKELVFLYMKLEEKYPERFKIQVYERLNEDTEEEVKKLFNFINLSLERQILSFILESKSEDSRDPYGVHRKEQDNNKWKKGLLTEIQNSIFNDIDFIEINHRFQWN